MAAVQVWYDNAQSLRLRYSLARQAGMRGVGSWRSDMVAYDTDVETLCSHELWSALLDGAARCYIKNNGFVF